MVKKIIILLFLVISFPHLVFAIRESQPLAVDKRLRVYVYNPNDVFKYTGFYGYEASIVFAADEKVETITMGDSLAWQVVPNGNRIFLKPIEDDAMTNMTVITDKRVYHFELHADNATSINDPKLIFSVKFLYPDSEGNSGAVQHFNDEEETFNIEKDSKNLNYDYTVSGPDSVAPIKAFDNGNFTYLEFSKNEQELPAIFVVYEDSSEGIVNFRVSGKYIVIERIAPRFTIRLGDSVGCVFNEKLLAKINSDAAMKRNKSKRW